VAAGRPRSIFELSNQARARSHQRIEAAAAQAQAIKESAGDRLPASAAAVAGGVRRILKILPQARTSSHQGIKETASQAADRDERAGSKLPGAVAGGVISMSKLSKQVRTSSHQGDNEAVDQAADREALRCQVATLVRKSLGRYLKEAGKREGGLKQGLPEGVVATILGDMRNDIESLKMAAHMNGDRNKVIKLKHSVTSHLILRGFERCLQV
jgi:hypothetical protein